MNKLLATLIGELILRIDVSPNMDELTFHTSLGTYRFYHEQDCCESVQIEDICGDFEDLIRSPITQATEAISAKEYDKDEDVWGTGTWTFYKFATNKGSVTIRWLGESNGYYGEQVNLQAQLRV